MDERVCRIPCYCLAQRGVLSCSMNFNPSSPNTESLQQGPASLSVRHLYCRKSGWSAKPLGTGGHLMVTIKLRRDLCVLRSWFFFFKVDQSKLFFKKNCHGTQPTCFPFLPRCNAFICLINFSFGYWLHTQILYLAGAGGEVTRRSGAARAG